MKDLIERLEKVTGPDREIDGAIWCACFPLIADAWPHWTPDQRTELPPRYTSSIDTALTLVPEGDGDRELYFDKKDTLAQIEAPLGRFNQGRHANMAIALAIAALKARSVTLSSTDERSAS